MRLDALSEAWNNLRNAALGRGVAPKVSKKLAAKVSRDYAAWRVAREKYSSSPITELGITAESDVLGSVVMRNWVARYRKLCAEVRAEGVKCKRLPSTSLERALQGVDRFNRNLAFGAGVAGVAVVTYFLVKTTGGPSE